MHRTWTSLLCLSTAAALAAQDDDEGRTLRGRVLGPGGEPVASAKVASSWFFDHPVPRTSTDSGAPLGPDGKPVFGEAILVGNDSKMVTRRWWGSGVVTEADGRFGAAFRGWQRERFALACFSADGKLGAVLDWPKKEVPADAEIRLQPTTRVRAMLACPQLGKDGVNAIAYVQSPAGTRLGMCGAEKALDLCLPPGDYVLYIYGRDLDNLHHKLTIPPAGGELDLGVLELPASFFALQRGKELPEWNVTAARGVEPGKTGSPTSAGSGS